MNESSWWLARLAVACAISTAVSFLLGCVHQSNTVPNSDSKQDIPSIDFHFHILSGKLEKYPTDSKDFVRDDECGTIRPSARLTGSDWSLMVSQSLFVLCW